MKKIMQQFGVGLLVLMAAAISACNSTNRAATAENGNNINRLSDSNWVFTATDVMPQYGSARRADGNYAVSFANNKMVVYLPYFGKAYSGVNVFSNTGPLDFTTTNFAITKKQTKKGHWSIIIKPKDYNEVQSMNFMFYDNGNANLSVTMTNRTPISFNGTVSGFK
jgi:hypothetical protein